MLATGQLKAALIAGAIALSCGDGDDDSEKKPASNPDTTPPETPCWKNVEGTITLARQGTPHVFVDRISVPVTERTLNAISFYEEICSPSQKDFIPYRLPERGLGWTFQTGIQSIDIRKNMWVWPSASCRDERRFFLDPTSYRAFPYERTLVEFTARAETNLQDALLFAEYPIQVGSWPQFFIPYLKAGKVGLANLEYYEPTVVSLASFWEDEIPPNLNIRHLRGLLSMENALVLLLMSEGDEASSATRRIVVFDLTLETSTFSIDLPVEPLVYDAVTREGRPFADPALSSHLRFSEGGMLIDRHDVLFVHQALLEGASSLGIQDQSGPVTLTSYSLLTGAKTLDVRLPLHHAFHMKQTPDDQIVVVGIEYIQRENSVVTKPKIVFLNERREVSSGQTLSHELQLSGGSDPAELLSFPRDARVLVINDEKHGIFAEYRYTAGRYEEVQAHEKRSVHFRAYEYQLVEKAECIRPYGENMFSVIPEMTPIVTRVGLNGDPQFIDIRSENPDERHAFLFQIPHACYDIENSRETEPARLATCAIEFGSMIVVGNTGYIASGNKMWREEDLPIPPLNE